MSKFLGIALIFALALHPVAANANQNYQLKITYQASAATKKQTWTLHCRPAAGSHLSPKAACTEIKAVQKPFARPPKEEICTKIYGGEQVAWVTGRWAGKVVKRKFTRVDGCEIARWDQLALTLSGKKS
jgi:hypothetical protein